MKLRYALMLALMIAVTTTRAELVMELSTSKAHYIQHEPFWVVLTFRNTGTQDEKLLRAFDTCIDYVTYYITPPDGKPYRYDSVGKCSGIDYRERLTICIGPGEKFTADADLSWEMRDPSNKPESHEMVDALSTMVDTLSRPGEHRIRASYRMRGEDSVRLESNECRIVVEEPQGMDRDVYNLLQKVPKYTDEMLWFPTTEGHELQRETWQQIVSRYPSSAYTPYVLFNLACDYDNGSLFKSDLPQREKRPKGAAQLFERCARSLGDSPLGAQAFALAAGNYREAGDREQWRRMFEAELTCAGMTDEWRLGVLAFLYIEGRKPPDHVDDIRVPLRPIGEAMGYKVAWNPLDKTVTVSNARVHVDLQPGAYSMTVNGVERTGMVTSIKNGQTMVSLSVLSPLVADRYGRCRKSGEKY